MESVTSNESKAKQGPTSDTTLEGLKWIRELRGKEAGKTCFLLGNGWSMNFFEPVVMKEHGFLIGCNLSFQRFPLDYLIWQDTGVTNDCVRAKGPVKLLPKGKINRVKGAFDKETTYVFGYGAPFRDETCLQALNSGGLAFQMAVFLGATTIIMVGCDCEVMKAPSSEYGQYRANIFKDKIAHKILTLKSKQDLELVNGRYTTAHLKSFATCFERLVRTYEKDVSVFKLGNFGIVNVPVLEWPAFYSEMHPQGRKQRYQPK